MMTASSLPGYIAEPLVKRVGKGGMGVVYFGYAPRQPSRRR